jgi:hypothetical protein
MVGLSRGSSQYSASRMTDRRKHRLIDCNPRWVDNVSDVTCYLNFLCPEGHEDCSHTIPFTPALDGTSQTSVMAQWERRGDTFETLTLTPSIARHQRYKNREEAIADGCLLEYITETLFCRMHVNLVDGRFEFCGDSC